MLVRQAGAGALMAKSDIPSAITSWAVRSRVVIFMTLVYRWDVPYRVISFQLLLGVGDPI